MTRYSASRGLLYTAPPDSEPTDEPSETGEESETADAASVAADD